MADLEKQMEDKTGMKATPEIKKLLPFANSYGVGSIASKAGQIIPAVKNTLSKFGTKLPNDILNGRGELGLAVIPPAGLASKANSAIDKVVGEVGKVTSAAVPVGVGASMLLSGAGDALFPYGSEGSIAYNERMAKEGGNDRTGFNIATGEVTNAPMQKPLAGIGLDAESLAKIGQSYSPLQPEEGQPKVAATPFEFDGKTDQADAGQAKIDTLKDKGYYSGIGARDTMLPREADKGQNTPTMFQWKDSKGNVIRPDVDASGENSWENKLKNQNNVKLSMIGIGSNLSDAERVDKQLAADALNPTSNTRMKSAEILERASASKLGMQQHKENLNAQMQLRKDSLEQQGKHNEALAEKEQFDEIEKVYKRKDEMGNENWDLSGIADRYNGNWDALPSVVKEAVFGHIRKFDREYEKAKNKKENAGKTRNDAWASWSAANRG